MMAFVIHELLLKTRKMLSAEQVMLWDKEMNKIQSYSAGTHSLVGEGWVKKKQLYLV